MYIHTSFLRPLCQPLAETNKRPSPLFGANPWVRDTCWITNHQHKKEPVLNREAKRTRKRHKISHLLSFCVSPVLYFAFTLSSLRFFVSHVAPLDRGSPEEIWDFVSVSQSKKKMHSSPFSFPSFFLPVSFFIIQHLFTIPQNWAPLHHSFTKYNEEVA